MKALVLERSLPRFAAARGAAGLLGSGKGVGVGPLRLADVAPLELPGPDWQRVRPLLSGICGSDLSTLDGHASRYFDPLVSFPFVPGHEVVGETVEARGQAARRVVIEPVLACAARRVEPPCPACAAGRIGNCERLAFGDLEPGLQTGYCTDTGGGWSGELVAHRSQLHPVGSDMSDEAAVMVEPAACAVHAVLRAGVDAGDTVAVLGAGTLGLCVLAALRRFTLPSTVMASARHLEQRRLASDLGADVVVAPDEIRRAVRRQTRSMALGTVLSGATVLSGGADVVIDCVGSPATIETALAVARPRGTVVLVGMPGAVRVDLAPLWQRELKLVGAYTYGREVRPVAPPEDGSEEERGGEGRERAANAEGTTGTFALAFELVASAGLERLVSARYPLERFEEAIAHAASAGRRGAVKVVFDPRAPGAARRRSTHRAVTPPSRPSAPRTPPRTKGPG